MNAGDDTFIMTVSAVEGTFFLFSGQMRYFNQPNVHRFIPSTERLFGSHNVDSAFFIFS